MCKYFVINRSLGVLFLYSVLKKRLSRSKKIELYKYKIIYYKIHDIFPYYNILHHRISQIPIFFL